MQAMYGWERAVLAPDACWPQGTLREYASHVSTPIKRALPLDQARLHRPLARAACLPSLAPISVRGRIGV